MRLPGRVVAGAVVGVASVGVKKVFSARSDLKEAKRLNEEGEKKLRRAEKRLKRTRADREEHLKALGQLKLEVWDRQLGRFVGLFQELHNVDLQGTPGMDELGAADEASLAEMQEVTRWVAEAVGGGAIAAPSMALIGVACYGPATLLGTASTGPAISSLGGVAATKATLAKFGGGLSATGGLRVAGVAVASTFAAGSMMWARKAHKVLDEAKKNHARNELAAKNMRKEATSVKGIVKEVVQFRELLVRLDECTAGDLNALEALLDRRGPDYAKYAESERRVVYRAWVFAKGLKAVLDAPILDERGALAKDYPKVLEDGHRMLAEAEEP